MIQEPNSNSKKKIRAPLIVDPDLKFLEELKNTKHSSHIQPEVTSTGREAQLLLAEPDTSFSGVFVNPAISNPGGISVIRCARLNKPATPIYVIHDNEPPFSESEQKSLGIQKQLKKPITLEQIMRLIAPSGLIFDPQTALDTARSDQEHALDKTVSVEDAKFIAIRSSDFLSGSISYFDIYVRLNANKYVKILQAGDKFQADRVQTYLAKGVAHFYMKKEVQEQYLSYCDQLTTSLLKRPGVPMSVKSSQVMNQGEETLKFLGSHGLSEVNLQYASQFLGNVNSLVKQLNPGKQPLLKGFLNDVVAYDHGVATALVASLLIPPFNITSLGPVETIGIAGLLHDIGLTQLSITTEEVTLMTPEQVESFHTHPTVGSEILSSIPGIKPATIQAVLQHHERRNKKGFPFGLGAGSVSLVAEIIGISDEFVRLVQRIKNGEKLDLAKEMKLNIFDGFSPKLVTEFKKVFLFSSEDEDESGKTPQNPKPPHLI